MKWTFIFLHEFNHFRKSYSKVISYLIFVLACIYSIYIGFSLQNKQHATISNIEIESKQNVDQVLNWFNNGQFGPKGNSRVDIRNPFWALRYIPTYSGLAYHKFNEINFVLPLLIILVTMQTKLGSKINILAERVTDIWNGNQNPYVGKTNQGNVKVSQPIVTPGIHQVSRADNLDNTLIAPPPQQMPAQNNISMIDALPNMVGDSSLSSFQNQAIQNSFMEAMEPMAANGALGGSFGTSF